MPSRRGLPALFPIAGLIVGLIAGIVAVDATAESRVVLANPTHFGVFPALTYDEGGRKIGVAELAVERQNNSIVTIRMQSELVDGPRTRAEAWLAEIDGGMRLLRERSQSHGPDGRSLGVMRIDHEQGVASCSPPVGSTDPVLRFDLPSDDHVANVPLNLLFRPLVDGSRERIDFQLFLCRGGPRVLDFAAWAVRPADGADAAVVEVRYRPDLGSFTAWFASLVSPNLSFWYDASATGSYLGHRMPLYSSGPEVLIVRSGVALGKLSRLP